MGLIIGSVRIFICKKVWAIDEYSRLKETWHVKGKGISTSNYFWITIEVDLQNLAIQKEQKYNF